MAVLNKHVVKGVPRGAVFIGRGSRWGNKFSHMAGTKAEHLVASRDEACDAHKADLWNQIRKGTITLYDLADLHGKDLVCYCAPQRCHGDTLEAAAAWAHGLLWVGEVLERNEQAPPTPDSRENQEAK